MGGYFYDRRKVFLIGGLCLLIFLVVLALFRLPLGAVAYASAICGMALAGFTVWDGICWRRRHSRLAHLEQEILVTLDNLPDPATEMEKQYQILLGNLFQAKQALEVQERSRFQEMTEYYTLWVHQIKTPIAAMQLILQAEEQPTRSGLSQELFQIQQYVEMVLGYLRLDSPTTDFLIQSYDLDGIVRQVLRKFGPSFIRKRLKLTFTPTHYQVVTDEKWLAFALEQILSNAVKYTAQGGVTVALEGQDHLTVADTGTGIAPEDLPRIFEKGYTGQMGRTDKRSTGIGLYLCRRTLEQLGHTICVRSTPGQGTVVSIGLARRDIRLE